MLRSLVASATTTAFLAAGCAAERPWPRQPVAVTTQAFAHQAEIATIDVLPLDLQMWGERDYNGDLDRVRGGAEINIMNVALETLARRNYAVGAMIDWNGDYPGGTALSKADLLATVGSLGHYGAAASEHPGELPVPFLPARLGATTGADATLYVGGWSYVASHHDSTGDQIVEAVVIGLLIISVVAIIAAVTKSSKSSSHSGGGGGHGGGASGGSHGGFSAARGVSQVHGAGAFHHSPSAAVQMVDAFGRTAVDLALSTADWGEDPALPHAGDSQMYLEMTLVDNHTGLALWHAHQIFPASAANPSETTRVARTMLGQLPGRALQTANN
ncbi:MAG: hypothetical protein ABIY55_04255 [Kofleriaceae bacterium]